MITQLKNMYSKHAAIPFLAAVALGFAACSSEQSLEVKNNTAQEQAETGIRFDGVITDLRMQVDARQAEGVPVPVPFDSGGGYTHEQHKQNAKTIYASGMLYRQTSDAIYRDFAKGILFDYAELYPTLGLHPKVKPETPSRLFWQGHVIQGYEAVKDDLSVEEREKIETGLIRPMAEFLSAGSPQTFNRIHNHGTWAAAAVGMTGYVLEDRDFVDKALYGLDKSGEAGFLRQVDMLFSPDGYYNEGPYYQRYALMPFVLFAQAIERNDPDLEIFDYRDGVLKKAIYATIQLSYGDKFFPLNDAIREKGLNTAELRYAVAIAYDLTGDASLLSIAERQAFVVPTPEGKAVADALDAGQATPFTFKSQQYRDGPEGNRGALIVLRSGPDTDDAALVFKAASQGLGHGHFDRLGLIYYDNGDEIFADYGAARFLNVEPKNGGKYLPENLSWAKQSVAHNTLVVDETSHFNGDWRVGEEAITNILAYDDTPGASFAGAEFVGGYDGVTLRRIVAMVDNGSGGEYIIDVMQGAGAGEHTFDLPVHFKGQLIDTTLPFTHATNQLAPLGSDNGYQHLWKTAETPPVPAGAKNDFSLVVKDKFYTITFKSDRNLVSYLNRLGANDPDNNLRNEQSLLLRAEGEAVSFMTVFERHGRYDNDEEVTVFNGGSVEDIQITEMDDASVYSLLSKTGGTVNLLVADSGAAETVHSVTLKGEVVTWTGPVGLHFVAGDAAEGN